MKADVQGRHPDHVASSIKARTRAGVRIGSRIFNRSSNAPSTAWKVADTAVDLGGAFGIFAASGIERLVRDARLGRIGFDEWLRRSRAGG